MGVQDRYNKRRNASNKSQKTIGVQERYNERQKYSSTIKPNSEEETENSKALPSVDKKTMEEDIRQRISGRSEQFKVAPKKETKQESFKGTQPEKFVAPSLDPFAAKQPTAAEAVQRQLDYDLNKFEVEVRNEQPDLSDDEVNKEVIRRFADEVNKASAIRTERQFKELGEEHPVAATLMSVGTNFVSPIGAVAMYGEAMKKGIDSGTYELKLDPNSPYGWASRVTTSAREGAKNSLESVFDSEAGKNIAGYAYDVGTGILDMAASGAVGGFAGNASKPVTLALMSAQAGAGTTQEAAERELPMDVALAESIGAFASSYMLERLPFDDIFNPKYAPTLKQLALNIIKGAVGEGLEEGAEDIINTAIDTALAGDQSEIKTSIRAYESQGYDTKEATKKALWDKIKEILYSTAVGAGSGGVMAGGGSLPGYVAQTAGKAQDAVRTYQTGKELTQNKNFSVDNLVEMGSKMSADSAAYKIADKVDENTGAYTIGKLFNSIGSELSVQNQQDIVKSLTRKGISEESANTYAGWLSDAINGAELTSAQIIALELNDDVANTIRDVIINPNSTINQRRQAWFEAGGFNTISNPDSNTNSQIPDKVMNRINQSQLFATQSAPSLETQLAQLAQETASKSTEAPTAEKSNPFIPLAKQTAPTQKTEKAKALDSVVAKEHDVSDIEGKTILKNTNEAVNIKKIASIDNNSMKLELDDGRVVSSKDVSYGTQGEALVYETVANMDVPIPADAANSIVSMYNPNGKQSAAVFSKGVAEAYRYGYLNMPKAEMLAKSSFAVDLTEHQRETAYKLGSIMSTTRAKADTQNVGRGKRGAITKGKVIYTGNSKLTQRQRTNLKALEVIANITGIQIEVFESNIDEYGRRIGENGSYDPNTGKMRIDLYAGVDGDSLMLFTAAHELTHHIKNWSPEKFKILADFLMEQYGEKGVSVDALVRAQIEKAARSGRTLTYEAAYEEVVADSMESMLSDGEAIVKLKMLATKDQSLVQKIRDFLGNLVAKIKKEYAGLKPDSTEGKLVADMLDTTERLQELFAEAIMDASVNYKSAKSELVNIDAASESASPKLSERTWTASSYVVHREATAKMLAQTLGVTKKKALEYIDNVNSIARLIADDRVRLDYEASPFGSAFVSNSEYGGSFDFTTLCKKRRLYTGTFSEIQKRLGDVALTPDHILEIRNMLTEAGKEATCGLCYVEGSRANMGKFAKEFIRLYKRDNPDAWIPSMYDVNTPDGVESMKRMHPEAYEQYEFFWNHYGKLKADDKALFASQQKPKLYESRKEYKGEILEYFSKDTTVQAKNRNGGIRMQSFSDFELVHLIDTMQIIMDMASVGLAGQAYTKVPEFADAFGNTGLKINLSLIAKGVDENGKLIFDDREGMPHETAFGLRNKYSKNVGTIIVTFTDEQLYAAMADSRIDFIIPFHRSQWKKGQYQAMGLPQGTKDYTYMQNEKLIKQTYHEYRGRMVKDKASNYMPNAYWNPEKSGKENAEDYLKMCAKENKRPKFYKLLDYDGKGTYSLKKDGSTDGYWKLLIDFKMYDNDGVSSPQQPVTPNFSMDEAIEMLNEYKGGHQSYPVAHDVVDRFVESYNGTNKNPTSDSDVRYSVREIVDEDGTNYGLGVYLDSQELAVLSEEERENTVKNHIKKLGGHPFSAFDNDGNEVKIKVAPNTKYKTQKGSRERANRHLTNFLANKEKQESLMLIDEIISSAKFIEKEPASKAHGWLDNNGENEWDAWTTYIQDKENTIWVAKLKIANTTNGEKVLYDVHPIEKVGRGRTLPTIPTVDIISQPSSDVKRSDRDITAMAKTAEEHFGTTNDVRESGYITINGKMLDFTGKHWGGTNRGSRQVDHEDVGEILPDDFDTFAITHKGNANRNGMAKYEFEKYGNIRTQPETGSIELAMMPTEKQKDAITHFFKRMRALGEDTLRVDINDLDKNGKLYPVTSLKYGRETSVEMIALDIEEYYKRGNLPEGVKEFAKSTQDSWKFSDREIGYGKLTQDRINYLIDDSGAGSNVDYAQAWIASINPTDFIDLTINYRTRMKGREAFDNNVRGDYHGLMADRDYISDLQNSRTIPRLKVDMDTGKVIGHDGRHRMRALEKAGASHTPVVIEFYKDDYLYKGNDDGVRLEAIDVQTLTSQFDEIPVLQTHGSIYDIIPLNEDHRAEIEKTYLVKETDVKYGNAIAYSDRDPDAITTRGLLADALESTAANDIERKKLADYKKKAKLMTAEEAKLAELRKQIKEASFSKGKRDTEKLKQLKEEATKTANRITTYDRQLLNLESTKALKNVLEREKKKAVEKQKQRDKELLAKKRQRAAEREQAIREEYRESRQKAVEGRHKTEMRNKIKKVVNELNQYLLNGTKDKHVMDGMQKAVAEALSIVNMDTVDADARVAKYDALIAEATDPDVIEALTATRDRIQSQGDRLADKLASLKSAYADIINSSDPTLSNAYDEVIEAKIASVVETVGDTPLRNMSMAQLEEVYDLYKMVLTNIRNANKLFASEKQETIEQLGYEADSEVKTATKQKDRMTAVNSFIRKVGYKDLKPIYFFRMLGSNTMTDLYKKVRDGQGTWFKDAVEARAFRIETERKYNYKQWDLKETYKFTAKSGKSFELTLPQIMSIYAFSRREQAFDHLIKGGIVFDDAVKVKEKKKGVALSYTVNTSEAFNLSVDTLGEIIDTLTEEQKSYVEDMQSYLSDTMGGKGNEVSLELYGVKLFKEKNYFPLKSSQYYMNFTAEEAGETKIKNSSFSKETVKHANNPIVLSNFIDVWANHVNDMSNYHAFVLPLEDFTRVYNYRTPTSEDVETTSVKSTIHNHYTEAANSYIKQLLKDINGGSVSGVGTEVIDKMVGLAKKGAVFASASVVVQQPSAIARAMAYVNPKYFVNVSSFNLKRHNQLWEECKQYAPVAGIKEMGYFDTSVGRTGIDWLKADEYDSVREKFFAFFKDKEQRRNIFDDALSFAPAMADELSWVALWEAVKKETRKTTNLEVGSEEFFKHCGERFTEVVDLTQVYDSVFARSELMRSKDRSVKMATSFMAEPTTQANMLFDAVLQLKRGKKSALAPVAATIGAVVGSVVLNSILKSFVLAGRDDDEDETYLEKYVSSFAGDVLSGLNPLTLIPFVKDIISIAQGYSVERMDTSVVEDIIGSIMDLGKDTKSDAEKVLGLIGSVANLFGVPAKNIIRDFNSAINVFNTFSRGDKTTGTGIKFALLEGLSETVTANLIKGVTGEGISTNKGKKYYDAAVSGDNDYIQKNKSEESVINSFKNLIKEKVKSGEISVEKGANMLSKYGGVDEEKAFENAQFYDFSAQHPDLTYDWSASTVASYLETAEPSGISVKVYDEYLVKKKECKGTDKDGDGKADDGTKKKEILKVIDSLPITSKQKDALYLMNNWSKSTLYEAPWH